MKMPMKKKNAINRTGQTDSLINYLRGIISELLITLSRVQMFMILQYINPRLTLTMTVTVTYDYY